MGNYSSTLIASPADVWCSLWMCGVCVDMCMCVWCVVWGVWGYRDRQRHRLTFPSSRAQRVCVSSSDFTSSADNIISNISHINISSDEGVVASMVSYQQRTSQKNSATL